MADKGSIMSAQTLRFLPLSAVLVLVGCSSLMTAPGSREPASEDRLYRNELTPFTSDGCSMFPNGIPYFNENKWLRCCVIHDVAYWQGGTAEQKLQADQNLRACVASTGEREIAELMYLGVRVGGYEGLPTTWRWGYGWKIARGDRALSVEEKEQVDVLKAQIPEDLDAIPVQSPPVVPQRATVTGDYCLDAAVLQVQSVLGHGFHIVEKSESFQDTSEGSLKTLTIMTDGCAKPFLFTFLQLKRDACLIPTNEVFARGRIRLTRAVTPRECAATPP